MGEFNVTCYVDEELISKKSANAIIKSVRDYVREDIEELVKDEIHRCEVSDLVFKLRKDDFEKFYWNAKEVDPTPEKLYKMLSAYVGYIDLLNDDLFRASVSSKVTSEIMLKLGKNHSYKAIAEAIENEMNEAKDTEVRKRKQKTIDRTQHIQPPDFLS